MDIVIADADGTPIRQTDDYTLDLAYGEDENDFELSDVSGPPLSEGMRWWSDGTPYGGIVDTVRVSSSEGTSLQSYKGRCVQGILAGKVVEPDGGQSHLSVTGEANAIIAQMLSRCGVPWLAASADDSGVEISGYRFHRYIDLYSGLRMMLASAGARLQVVFESNVPMLSAVPSDTYGEVPSERVDFTAERTYRPVNHLIGLGTGEGAAREVVHWYADADGNVSQTQTLVGLDEVAEVYDLSSESEDLSGKTRDKLLEYQGQGTFETDLPEDADLDVGDIVTASDAVNGRSITAEVVKVIVSADAGEPTVSREVGTPQWPEEEA